MIKTKIKISKKEIYALRTKSSGYEIIYAKSLKAVKEHLIKNLDKKEPYDLSKFDLINRDNLWDELSPNDRDKFRKENTKDIELDKMNPKSYRDYINIISNDYDMKVAKETETIDPMIWLDSEFKEEIKSKLMRRKSGDFYNDYDEDDDEYDEYDDDEHTKYN